MSCKKAIESTNHYANLCIFLFFITVLEASDADNLLEQFEEASSDFEDDFSQNNNSCNIATSADDSEVTEGDTKNPRKTSNIFKAVQNHFAASVANNESNSANGGCRRLPRIGKSPFFNFMSLCIGVAEGS